MRHYYANSLDGFLQDTTETIIGTMAQKCSFAIVQQQTAAWISQIETLKKVINIHDGEIFFEYSIPRMGRRVDVVIITKSIILVIEFKVGESSFPSHAIDQVWDYALDLKNFHETSQKPLLAPILVSTAASDKSLEEEIIVDVDGLFVPLKTNANKLGELIDKLLRFAGEGSIDIKSWSAGRYSPTPTIIEAATALYNQHSVGDISRSDASAKNLRETGAAISLIIQQARAQNDKVICFVTGVPGAGKTLVGLDIATKHLEETDGANSVFLSGNGPLVAILREALARDSVRRASDEGVTLRKGDARSRVKVFIQNVHHYRDEYLNDKGAPFDHVAIFDEAQRAWDREQTISFMRRKKGVLDFDSSEPEFLISCLDRHKDWAVVICLVGGGQEIHLGESGISEWIDSINRSFGHWKVCISNQLTDSEYAAGNALEQIKNKTNLHIHESLHLSVSMRSFRAENVSKLVKAMLDLEPDKARDELKLLNDRYPIFVTRDINIAKGWLRKKARGTERYGMVVSSNAYRLKPHAIYVKSPMNPVNWFLEGKDDVRSSYFLEDVATEFHVQGLELDWACVTWDADFRYTANGWDGYNFKGNKWQKVRKEERKQYLINSYRVLLTRARQGMIIVVPEGDDNDSTRKPEWFDSTYDYLVRSGIRRLNPL